MPQSSRALGKLSSEVVVLRFLFMVVQSRFPESVVLINSNLSLRTKHAEVSFSHEDSDSFIFHDPIVLTLELR